MGELYLLSIFFSQPGRLLPANRGWVGQGSPPSGPPPHQDHPKWPDIFQVKPGRRANQPQYEGTLQVLYVRITLLLNVSIWDWVAPADSECCTRDGQRAQLLTDWEMAWNPGMREEGAGFGFLPTYRLWVSGANSPYLYMTFL